MYGGWQRFLYITRHVQPCSLHQDQVPCKITDMWQSRGGSGWTGARKFEIAAFTLRNTRGLTQQMYTEISIESCCQRKPPAVKAESSTLKTSCKTSQRIVACLRCGFRTTREERFREVLLTWRRLSSSSGKNTRQNSVGTDIQEQDYRIPCAGS